MAPDKLVPVPEDHEVTNALRWARTLTKAQLIEEIGKIPNPQKASNIAAKQALAELEDRAASERHQDVHGKLSSIDSRLVAVETRAKTPEVKTFSFWLAIVAIIVAFLAWFVPRSP